MRKSAMTVMEIDPKTTDKAAALSNLNLSEFNKTERTESIRKPQTAKNNLIGSKGLDGDDSPDDLVQNN